MRYQPPSPRLVRALCFWPLLALIAVYALRSPVAMIARTDMYLQWPADDFYYYAIIADNIAHHGRSTFDGITSTNGYHPLWMGIMIMLTSICRGIGPLFFIALSVLQAGLALWSWRLLARLCSVLFGDNTFTLPAAAIVAALTLPNIFNGMESGLAIPLFLLLLLEVADLSDPDTITARAAMRLGFLSSMLILARLDAVLLVAILLAGWIMLPRVPLGTRFQRIGTFAVGGIPLALYVAWNMAAYGAPMPISGQAKQLATSIGLSMHVLGPIVVSAPARLALLLVIVGIAAQHRARRHPDFKPMPAHSRFAAICIVLFPVFFLALHAHLSDWRTWPWYNYWQPALQLLLLGWIARSVLLIAPDAETRLHSMAPAACATMLAVMTIAAAHQSTAIDPDWIYAHAKVLAAFAQTHPGRYAMGDRAGLTAYLLGRPMVQLEGLVGDAHLLGHIAHRDRLEQVLKEYGIDYLIVSVYAPLARRDYSVRVTIPDSLQCGPRSPKMTGWFPDAPLLRFTRAGRCITYVFGVGGRSTGTEH